MISWNSPSIGSDQAEQFRSFFTVKTKVPALLPVLPVPASVPVSSHEGNMIDNNANEICQGYLSDVLSEGDDINWTDDEDDSLDLDVPSEPVIHPSSTQNIVSPPPAKTAQVRHPSMHNVSTCQGGSFEGPDGCIA